MSHHQAESEFERRVQAAEERERSAGRAPDVFERIDEDEAARQEEVCRQWGNAGLFVIAATIIFYALGMVIYLLA